MIDVKGIDANRVPDWESVAKAATRTTLFIAYWGYTEYGYLDNWENELDPGPASKKYKGAAEESEDSATKYEYVTIYKNNESDIFLAKADGDTNQYYVKVVGIAGGDKFIPLMEFASGNVCDGGYKYGGIIDQDGNYLSLLLDDEYGNIGSEIIVATDAEGNNVVMTVTLSDETPLPEEFYQEKNNDDGNTWLEPVEEAPENYVDPDAEDLEESTVEYNPEEGKAVEVVNKTSDTADVILRDSVGVQSEMGIPG